MHRKTRLKYTEAIGKHGFAVKLKYSTEAINLIRFLGCLLKMDYLGRHVFATAPGGDATTTAGMVQATAANSPSSWLPQFQFHLPVSTSSNKHKFIITIKSLQHLYLGI